MHPIFSEILLTNKVTHLIEPVKCHEAGVTLGGDSGIIAHKPIPIGNAGPDTPNLNLRVDKLSIQNMDIGGIVNGH